MTSPPPSAPPPGQPLAGSWADQPTVFQCFAGAGESSAVIASLDHLVEQLLVTARDVEIVEE